MELNITTCTELNAKASAGAFPGCTALHLAAVNGHAGVCVALLARASGDAIQSLMDGCYWKVGMFARMNH